MDYAMDELLKWPSPCCEEEFKHVDLGLECQGCKMVYLSSKAQIQAAERLKNENRQISGI